MRVSFLLFLASTLISANDEHGVGEFWGREVPLPITNERNMQRGVLYNNIVATSTGRIIISVTKWILPISKGAWDIILCTRIAAAIVGKNPCRWNHWA